MAMDQYLYIPFLVGWTSIYQLFWCELQGYKVLTHPHIMGHHGDTNDDFFRRNTIDVKNRQSDSCQCLDPHDPSARALWQLPSFQKQCQEITVGVSVQKSPDVGPDIKYVWILGVHV
jgi:hypothetical protein